MNRNIKNISLAEYQEKKAAGLLDPKTIYMVIAPPDFGEEVAVPTSCEVYDAGGNRVQ